MEVTLFCVNVTATHEIYTYCPPRSLPDALPISLPRGPVFLGRALVDRPRLLGAGAAGPGPRPHRRPARQRHAGGRPRRRGRRSEPHTTELQSPMRISYAVFCLKKKNTAALPPAS